MSKANERDILFNINMRNKFNISKHSCSVLFITVYKKIVLLPHKNKAINRILMHFMIIDTCEIIDFIS